MDIIENGEATEWAFDNIPYVKDEALYMPCMDIALALELDIFWEAFYKTVVIIDTKEVIAEIDKDFTIINQLFSMPYNIDAGDFAYKAALDVLASVTQFSTLDGDLTADVGAGITVVYDGSNFRIAGKADVSGLIDMISAGDGLLGYDLDDVGLPPIDEMAEMIQNLSVEIIIYLWDSTGLS
jgi:hypothetical protein